MNYQAFDGGYAAAAANAFFQLETLGTSKYLSSLKYLGYAPCSSYEDVKPAFLVSATHPRAPHCR